jgi:hypothetical protein
LTIHFDSLIISGNNWESEFSEYSTLFSVRVFMYQERMSHLSQDKQIKWSGEPSQSAIDLLQGEGNVVVCPTKVGYIITVSDKKGLERKFSAKNRKRNKPGVVL